MCRGFTVHKSGAKYRAFLGGQRENGSFLSINKTLAASDGSFRQLKVQSKLPEEASYYDRWTLPPLHRKYSLLRVPWL